jgi:hypothetical protein
MQLLLPNITAGLPISGTYNSGFVLDARWKPHIGIGIALDHAPIDCSIGIGFTLTYAPPE